MPHFGIAAAVASASAARYAARHVGAIHLFSASTGRGAIGGEGHAAWLSATSASS